MASTALEVGDLDCPNGGVRLTVGGVDTFACNGTPGADGLTGATGASGESVVGASLNVGDPSCPYGGAQLSVGGADTYACNGMPGAEGPAGDTGPKGDAGAAGTSVVGASVPAGNASCPYGGSRFTSASGTTYACNAPGSVPSIDVGSFRVLVDYGSGAPALFSEVEGLGSGQEIIEQKIVVGTQVIVRKFPGRLSWGDVVLRRGVTSDMGLWNWRAQVETGAIDAARRTATVSLLDELGAVVSSWTLANVWPSSLTVPAAPGPFSPYVIDELTLVAEGETRDPGGSRAPGQPPLGFSFALFLANGERFDFAAASGIGSSSEVIEHKVVVGTQVIIQKVPGRLNWGDVKLRCVSECGQLLRAWRAQVEAGLVAQARQDVNLRLINAAGVVTAGWDFAQAWPSQVRLVPAPGGGTFEELTFVHEGQQRIQ